MNPQIAVRFDRGTLDLGASHGVAFGAIWDPRTATRRLPAYRFAEVAMHADCLGATLDGDPRVAWTVRKRSMTPLALRAYQEEALAAWTGFGRRGVVALPTGAGKTRVAIAAILDTGLPTAILCPTRALASAWRTELHRWMDEDIGLVGDGERRIERVTVLTFESAFRQMDVFGDRFGLLIVDEVHHFGSGARIEALEACVAPARLGLTATAPEVETEARRRIDELVGHVVFEMGFGELVGRFLAPVRLLKISVRLEPDERETYAAAVRAFREMRRAYLREYPGAELAVFMRALARSPEGLRAIREHTRAQALASFPRGKRGLVRTLLARHRDDKTIVFTAFAENAYDVAVDNLVPVIAAETGVRERESILARFRAGPLRAIASARVLNEGIDVPDARVAIIVAGTLGAREHVQRIGRVLRPSPGKEALVYELMTTGTADAVRAWKRTARALPSTP